MSGAFALTGDGGPALHCSSWQLAELCDPVGNEPFTLLDTAGVAVTADAESGRRSGRLTLRGDEFCGVDALHATLDLAEVPDVLDRHGAPVLEGVFRFTVSFGSLYVDRGFPATWSQEGTYVLVKSDALESED